MEVLADAQVAFGGLDRGVMGSGSCECRKPLALAYRGWRFEAAQTGVDHGIHPPRTGGFPFPSMVLRCCLIECARRKCDPSRAGGGILPGRPVAGPGDRAGLPGCPGVSGWHAASVGVSSGGGTHPRSRPAPDSRNRRCRTSPRNQTLGKTTAATPLLWPSRPARFHSRLRAVGCGPRRWGYRPGIRGCDRMGGTDWEEV